MSGRVAMVETSRIRDSSRCVGLVGFAPVIVQGNGSIADGQRTAERSALPPSLVPASGLRSPLQADIQGETLSTEEGGLAAHLIDNRTSRDKGDPAQSGTARGRARLDGDQPSTP